MSTPPLFSILICTVGKAELTRGAIGSILAQSLQDFEVIVTDTSGGPEIERVVAAINDLRVRFFRVPENDPTRSWDFAYSCSSGSFVLWYDDDNALVPTALERFAQGINQEGADIISGNHTYYYGQGNRHYPQFENVLGLVPSFSLTRRRYDPESVLRAVYGYSFGTAAMPPRWHSAATFVSREICDAIRDGTGHVVTPGFLGNFHLHPLIFAYATCPVFDDTPLAVIGKMGNSQTQQWSNVFIGEKRDFALPYRHTGVTARNLANTTAECYLAVQKLLPQRLGGFALNWEAFLRRYLGELRSASLPLAQHLYHWRELNNALVALPRDRQLAFRASLVEGLLASLAKHGLTALHVWPWVRQTVYRIRGTSGSRKFVELSRYGVSDVAGCAKVLHDVLEQEFGIPLNGAREKRSGVQAFHGRPAE